MKLLLNGRELEGFLPEGATLGSALMTLQNERIGENEVIAAVWVDGEPLTAERLAEWKDRPAEDFGETQVEAPTRNALASHGLRLMKEGLAESESARSEIVEHLCQGRSSEAMEQLSGYLQIWNAAQQTMGSVCRLLNIEPESLEIYGPQNSEDPGHIQCVTERISQLSEQLQQLKSALEVGDMVMLGDILDYEFGPVTADWQNMLEQLADRFETQT